MVGGGQPLATRAPRRERRPAGGGLVSPRLVGRDDEAQRLLEALTAAPSFALIEGEAGVGKTRLITELLTRPQLRGTPALLGRAHPLPDPFPLGPVVEALGRADVLLTAPLDPVAGALRPLLPELSDRLPPPLPPLDDRQAARHRLFRGLLEVFGALGEAIVVLEDLHWSDETTKEFLAFLLAQPPSGVRLIVSCRREELREDDPLLVLPRLPGGCGALRIPLGPLDVEGVGQLVGSLVGAEHVSAAFAAHLHERTGGVPFVVEEVMRLLQDRHDVIRREGRCERKAIEELDVPSGVRDTFLARLRRTSRDARRIVAAAAVAGRPADQQVLVDITDLPAVQGAEALTEAVAAGMLQAVSSGYDFRHALARQVAYDEVAAPARTLLHRRAAETLQNRPGTPPLAELAEHYKHAGDATAWMRCAEQTADAAVAMGNDDAAVPLLIELLSDAPLGPDDRAKLAVKLAHCALESMRHAEAIPTVQAVAHDEAISEPPRGEVLCGLGHLLAQAGDPAGGRAAMQAAIPMLRSRPDLAVRAMTTIALTSVIQGRPLAHAAQADQALRLTHSQQEHIRDVVEMDCANVLLNTGEERGWEPAQRLLDDPGWAGDLRQRTRGCHNFAWIAARLGHYERAGAFLAQGMRLSEESGYMRLTEPMGATGIWLDWCVGNWSPLHNRLEEFLAPGPAAPLEAFTPRAVLGLLLLATERTDKAERLLAPLLAEALERDVAEAAAAAASGLVRLHLAGRRGPAAVEAGRAAFAAVSREGTGISVTDIAVPVVEALLAAGEHGKAESCVSRAADLLDGRDAPAAHAAVLNARAVLAAATPGPAAVDALQAGVEAWDALPRPYDAGQARERLGGCLLATGEDPAPALRASLDTYERLGAHWDAGRVRRSLRDAGINLAHRRPRQGYGNHLSPREEEVARLVAKGLTSQQIGEQLFLSPRTVDDHVANARRKLGAASRRELARMLRDDDSVGTTV